MINTSISVLLIEDNPADAELLREILDESSLHCAIEHADRLSNGLARLERGRYDIILLDLFLPDLHKQLVQVRQAGFAEVGDGVVIGVQIAGKKAKRCRFIGSPFDLARTEGAGGIAIAQQAKQHIRGIRFAAPRSIVGIQRGQVELRDHVHDESRQVVRWQAIPQAHGRVEGGLIVDGFEFSAHASKCIIDEPDRRGVLSDKLLAYSQVGRAHAEFTPTDCARVLEQVLAVMAVTIADAGATISADSLPTVLADARQIDQLLQNLISNAIKFHGADPPQIQISATRQDADWLFAVRDNGIGIDPQYAERIFVIFQRLHTRVEYPGTGIGLAICKKIVDHHGGRIWIESQPGQGTTVFFTLPVLDGVQTQMLASAATNVTNGKSSLQ